MKNTSLILASPNRENISYAVQVVTPDPAKTFQTLVQELKEQKGHTKRIIIYCQTIKVTSYLYSFFVSELGDNLCVDNSGDPRKRTVEMFHSRIDELNREHILQSMAKPDGSIRLLIATIAYGMGIDWKNVSTIIHYGPSYNLETYMQESGRAGRSNSVTCKSVILYSSLMMRHCSDEIKNYVRESSKCRRKMLMENFDADLSKTPLTGDLHQCCDICQKKCKCRGDYCDFVFFIAHSIDNQDTSNQETSRAREVTSAQRTLLRQKLGYLKVALNEYYLRKAKNIPMFTPANLSGRFGDTEMEETLNNCEKILTVADIFKFVNIWHLNVANEILFAFSKVFDNVDVPDYSEEIECDDFQESYEDIFYLEEDESLLAGISVDLFSVGEDCPVDVEDEYGSDFD